MDWGDGELTPSTLDTRLRVDGFKQTAMYSNSDLANSQTLKNVSKDPGIKFRIIPAHLAFTDAPPKYAERHIIYISTTSSTSPYRN